MVLRSFSAVVILILSFLPASARSVTSSPPVVIGTSNSPLATAWNNARKIERTSDDIRLVVYQDSLTDGPVVMWTASADGIEWSEPGVLGRGEFPALAIDAEDRFYAAWTDSAGHQLHVASFDRQPFDLKKLTPTESRAIDFNSGALLRYVSLEASESGLHLVAERYHASGIPNQLYYMMMDKESFRIIYESTFDSELSRYWSKNRPTITGDLEFESGILLIGWTEQIMGSTLSGIGLMLVSETVPALGSAASIVLNIKNPTELMYRSNPSTSFRSRYSSYYNDYFGEFVLACSNEESGAITISAGSISSDGDFSLKASSFSVTGNPMVSVDDLVPYRIACAVIWQDSGNIHYGQFEDGRSFNPVNTGSDFAAPPVPVGEDNGSPKIHPSVCYRTFRGGLFDVVWTEGDRPPYKVMYRRMPKCYALNPIRFVSTDIPRAAVGMHYSGWIETSGGDSGYWPSFKILQGRLPEGMGSFYYQDIQGTPQECGSFPFTLQVTDFARASSDTADFVLVVQKNTPHRLTSPETMNVAQGSHFDFTPTISDSESNPILLRWTVVPDWLYLINNHALIGTVPADAEDTFFTVIADDGEFSDTLTVQIHIVPTGVSDNPAGSSVPEEYSLTPNFPNPFNPTTTVRFGLPVSGRATVDLIGLNGELKMRVLEGTLNAGWHSVIVNGTDLASGTYLIRLSAGGRSTVRKCVLLK